ncbi:EAL domain-containing protein [Nitratireductor sp. CAU 1489]|uniref:EAL domain-containing protein n=1 Tax=Nitratireductor arenosus TaxID=2682096 RepID=A0A844QK01_9HYPH|nr:EAL domain-containing protein [Nitratireductor arenosus]
MKSLCRKSYRGRCSDDGAAVGLLAAGLVMVSTSANAAEGTVSTAALLGGGALFASLLALAFALAAHLRAKRVADQFETLLRSVDHALRQVASTSNSSAGTIAEMQETIRGEIETLSLRVAGRDERDGNTPNVVSIAAVRPPSVEPTETGRDDRAIELALSHAVAEERIELSLQPIVSVGANAAAGFDAFVLLQLENGEVVNIGRIAETTDLPRARLERLLISRAAEAARRLLGAGGEATPLHCPISESLFQDRDELRLTVEFLALHPPLARLVVLSVPSGMLTDAATPLREALDELLETGVTLAAEGWDGTTKALPALRALQVGHLKLDADRLLDRTKKRRRDPAGLDIINAAAECGIQVIATRVSNDEDAVNLLDLGIDLMIGDRFSQPRRLRSGMGRVA